MVILNQRISMMALVQNIFYNCEFINDGKYSVRTITLQKTIEELIRLSAPILRVSAAGTG